MSRGNLIKLDKVSNHLRKISNFMFPSPVVCASLRKKFETNTTPECRVLVAQNMNYMTNTSPIKLKPCKPKQTLIRGWMHNNIHLYPSMVIDVMDSVTAAIDEGQCPYECTLLCLKRPVTWSSIDVTY